jgi:hypothetical protein
MDKALCIPRTSEMQIFGDYNLGYGSVLNLGIYPKCNSNDIFGENVECTGD